MTCVLNALKGKNLLREFEMKTGSRDDITEMLFRSNELAGEAGECANAIKKIARTLTGSSFTKGQPDLEALYENLRDELGDIVICADRLATFLGVELRDCIAPKFNKTSRKVGSQIFMDLPDE